MQDHDVIDVGRDFERMRDYIEGRLSEEEHRAFEERLARDPELVRELERSLQMREGLLQLESQGYFSRSAAKKPAPRLSFPVAAAAAAAVVALAFGGWLWRMADEPALTLLASPGTTATRQVSARFSFVSMRDDEAPELVLPGAGLIDFRSRPEAPSPAGYSVTLSRSDSAGVEEALATVTDLRASADGYVHTYTDAARLKPGKYSLRLEPAVATPAAPQTFHFVFRSPGDVAAP